MCCVEAFIILISREKTNETKGNRFLNANDEIYGLNSDNVIVIAVLFKVLCKNSVQKRKVIFSK